MQLHDNDIEALATVLKKNKTITHLVVNSNEGVDVTSWGELLNGNDLVSLDLSRCGLESYKVNYLLEHLIFSTSLKHLNLSRQHWCTGIISNGLLSRVIERNSTLISLNLSHVNRELNGCRRKRLLRALRNNDTLMYLNLFSWDGFTEGRYERMYNANWRRISDMLGVNSCLTELWFGPVEDMSVRTVLLRNKRIWRQKMYWCYWMLVLARIFFLSSRERYYLAVEMLDYILFLVPPLPNLISSNWRRRVMEYASNRETLLETEKKRFEGFVFGSVSDLIHAGRPSV